MYLQSKNIIGNFAGGVLFWNKCCGEKQFERKTKNLVDAGASSAGSEQLDSDETAGIPSNKGVFDANEKLTKTVVFESKGGLIFTFYKPSIIITTMTY